MADGTYDLEAFVYEVRKVFGPALPQIRLARGGNS